MLLCFWLLLHRHYVNQIIDSESSMQKQIRVKRQIMPRVKIISRPSVEKIHFESKHAKLAAINDPAVVIKVKS